MTDSVVAQTLEGTFVIRPATLHLHPQRQHDFAAKKFFHVEARVCTYALETLPTIADNNGFLAITFDQNKSTDAFELAFLLELLDLHRNFIRHFIAKLAHDFFTHNFSRKETGRTICNLILSKKSTTNNH